MCAQFIIAANNRKLERKYGLPARSEQTEEINVRILPYRPAPVIYIVDGERQIEEMSFSLIPSWSKEPRVKFATHNARLDGISEKPTWKRPFQNHRCLVPMTSFIEPIYTGEYAGNMVAFKQSKEEILSAAAIYDNWTNKATGEIIHSFAIITDDPPDFIKKIGHDRCPIFLEEKSFDDWLSPVKAEPEALVKLLRKYRTELDFEVTVDRPLKAGWEKRK